MLHQNDQWFINESLDFYLSTNTFSNPMFDGSQNYHEEKASARNVSNQALGKPRQRSATLEGHQRSSRLCDNLRFSFISKVHVWELNFKRRLRRLRVLADKHLPRWIIPSRNGASGKRCGVARGVAFKEEPANWGGESEDDFYASGGKNSSLEDKFWTNFEPDSRKSLNVQQEKILSRLERVVQAKRSSQKLFNMDRIELDENEEEEDNDSHVRLAQSKVVGDFRHYNSSITSIDLGNSSSSSNDGENYKLTGRKTAPAQGFGCRRSARIGSSAKVAPSEPSTSKRACIVCYSNLANIITFPCKHHQVCSDCFIELIYLALKQSQFPLKCVLCRQKIERIKCSHRLLFNPSTVRKLPKAFSGPKSRRIG